MRHKSKTSRPRVDLALLEIELKKRLQDEKAIPPRWGRKQNDQWDRLTNFVYTTPGWAGFRQKAAHFSPELASYAANRWFNFWSAMAVERIFANQPGVIPAPNPRDRQVDFYLQGIRFDHKTTVFPGEFPLSANFAHLYPVSLAEWLYLNQSEEQRWHAANRLFLVLYAQNGHHWRLRAELTAMAQVVRQYVETFDQERLIRLKLDGHEVLSDIIWLTR